MEVWEQSVRATHLFLKIEDIAFYKSIVEKMDFSAFDVYCVFDSVCMVGILGVANHKLEMLFLRPGYIGKGIGRYLMNFVLRELGVNQVDVNEGNAAAVAFYEKFGFQCYDRTALDDSGRPYPILKMRLPG